MPLRGVSNNQADKRGEDRAREGLGQQVSNHYTPRQVLHAHHAARHEVAQELRSPEDVLGLAEGDRVERHVDGRVRVREDRGRAVGVDAELDEQLSEEDGGTVEFRRLQSMRPVPRSMKTVPQSMKTVLQSMETVPQSMKTVTRSVKGVPQSMRAVEGRSQ